MKLKSTTPFLILLAVALSPVVRADEATPAQAQKPAAETSAPVQATPGNEVAPQVVAGMQKHIETLAEAIHKAQLEASDASKQRDAAYKEALAVREAKQQIEGQLGGLKKQLDASSQEVSQWKEKASTLEKKATVLEKKLGAGEEAYAKLGNFRDEMTNALKEFAVLKNDLASVRGELQAPAERVALKKQVAEVEASRETLASKLDTEVKAHTESKGLLAVLGKKLEEIKNSAKTQLEELAKVQRERDELGKNLALTHEQLNGVRQEATGLKEAKTAVEKDLASARGELSQTQTMLATLQKDAAELRATMAPLAAGIQEAKDQASKATAAIREASTARVRAENEATQVKNQLQVTNERLAEALKAQDGLKQQVHTKTTELDGLRKKVEQLEATAQANTN
jgi:chromosome segregation ATPase